VRGVHAAAVEEAAAGAAEREAEMRVEHAAAFKEMEVRFHFTECVY
jgi:hypothetical protein